MRVVDNAAIAGCSVSIRLSVIKYDSEENLRMNVDIEFTPSE